MRVKIQKWGNSLALRIPKTFASQSKISQDSIVSLSIEENRVVITPVEEKKYTLKSLVSEISESNLHGEVNTGKRMGKELW